MTYSDNGSVSDKLILEAAGVASTVEPISDVLMIHPYDEQKFLDGALALGWRTIKPVVATE